MREVILCLNGVCMCACDLVIIWLNGNRLQVWSEIYLFGCVKTIWLQKIWKFGASLIAQLVKNLPTNEGDCSSIPWLGRSTGEGIGYPLQYSWTSLVAQLVKNLPAMWETWLWSLGWEDPLEKWKATHSSILAGEFHGLQNPCGHKELDTTEWPSLS